MIMELFGKLLPFNLLVAAIRERITAIWSVVIKQFDVPS